MILYVCCSALVLVVLTLVALDDIDAVFSAWSSEAGLSQRIVESREGPHKSYTMWL